MPASSPRKKGLFSIFRRSNKHKESTPVLITQHDTPPPKTHNKQHSSKEKEVLPSRHSPVPSDPSIASEDTHNDPAQKKVSLHGKSEEEHAKHSVNQKVFSNSQPEEISLKSQPEKGHEKVSLHDQPDQGHDKVFSKSPQPEEISLKSQSERGHDKVFSKSPEPEEISLKSQPGEGREKASFNSPPEEVFLKSQPEQHHEKISLNGQPEKGPAKVFSKSPQSEEVFSTSQPEKGPAKVSSNSQSEKGPAKIPSNSQSDQVSLRSQPQQQTTVSYASNSISVGTRKHVDLGIFHYAPLEKQHSPLPNTTTPKQSSTVIPKTTPKSTGLYKTGTPQSTGLYKTGTPQSTGLYKTGTLQSSTVIPNKTSQSTVIPNKTSQNTVIPNKTSQSSTILQQENATLRRLLDRWQTQCTDPSGANKHDTLKLHNDLMKQLALVQELCKDAECGGDTVTVTLPVLPSNPKKRPAINNEQFVPLRPVAAKTNKSEPRPHSFNPLLCKSGILPSPSTTKPTSLPTHKKNYANVATSLPTHNKHYDATPLQKTSVQQHIKHKPFQQDSAFERVQREIEAEAQREREWERIRREKIRVDSKLEQGVSDKGVPNKGVSDKGVSKNIVTPATNYVITRVSATTATGQKQNTGLTKSRSTSSIKEVLDALQSPAPTRKYTPTLSKNTPTLSKSTATLSKSTATLSKSTATLSKSTATLYKNTSTLSKKYTPPISRNSLLPNKNTFPHSTNILPSYRNSLPISKDMLPSSTNTPPISKIYASPLSKKTPLTSNSNPSLGKSSPPISKETPFISKETPSIPKNTPSISKETPLSSNKTPAHVSSSIRSVLASVQPVLFEMPVLRKVTPPIERHGITLGTVLEHTADEAQDAPPAQTQTYVDIPPPPPPPAPPLPRPNEWVIDTPTPPSPRLERNEWVIDTPTPPPPPPPPPPGPAPIVALLQSPRAKNVVSNVSSMSMRSNTSRDSLHMDPAALIAEMRKVQLKALSPQPKAVCRESSSSSVRDDLMREICAAGGLKSLKSRSQN